MPTLSSEAPADLIEGSDRKFGWAVLPQRRCMVEMARFFQQAMCKYRWCSLIFGKVFVAAVSVPTQIAITQKSHGSIWRVPAKWSEPPLLVTVVPFQ